MIALDIDADLADVRAFAESAQLTADEIDKAIKRAAQRAATVAQNVSRNAMRDDVKAAWDAARRRIMKRIRTANGRVNASVFLGLNDLDLLRDLRQPGVQDKAGVRAGGRRYRSAFIAPVRGKQHVFRRRGKSRLPIDKVGHEIADEGRNIAEKAARQAFRLFGDLAFGEIRKAIEKGARRA